MTDDGAAQHVLNKQSHSTNVGVSIVVSGGNTLAVSSTLEGIISSLELIREHQQEQFELYDSSIRLQISRLQKYWKSESDAI